MKKILVLGAGAQGSVVVRHLDREAEVKEIISADYDLGAARTLVKGLKKAKALQVDANDIEEILVAAKGAQVIVNALPPDFNPTVMEAAKLDISVDEIVETRPA